MEKLAELLALIILFLFCGALILALLVVIVLTGGALLALVRGGAL